MARKVTLVGFLGMLRPGSVAQLVAASMVAILALLAQAIAQPYKRLSDSALAMCCDIVLVATLVWCFVLHFVRPPHHRLR